MPKTRTSAQRKGARKGLIVQRQASRFVFLLHQPTPTAAAAAAAARASAHHARDVGVDASDDHAGLRELSILAVERAKDVRGDLHGAFRVQGFGFRVWDLGLGLRV